MLNIVIVAICKTGLQLYEKQQAIRCHYDDDNVM